MQGEFDLRDPGADEKAALKAEQDRRWKLISDLHDKWRVRMQYTALAIPFIIGGILDRYFYFDIVNFELVVAALFYFSIAIVFAVPWATWKCVTVECWWRGIEMSGS